MLPKRQYGCVAELLFRGVSNPNDFRCYRTLSADDKIGSRKLWSNLAVVPHSIRKDTSGRRVKLHQEVEGPTNPST